MKPPLPFFLLLVLAGAAHDAAGAAPVYRETRDDPPAAARARDNLSARSPGMRVVVGPYVSIQVNVDALGLNIVGDAANEPSIAVNPTNSDNIVIGWRQFDSIASNFRQGGWAYSTDAGQHWTFPGVLEPGVFRSDPVLDTDTGGMFLYQSLQESFVVDVFRSLDGGSSWLAPVLEYGGDKNWLTVDKSGGIGNGHVYGTWQRFAGCCGQRTLTRSTDAGGSFEEPVALALRPLFGTMAVGPDGELYVSGIEGTVTQDFDQFVIARSDDAQNPAVAPSSTGVRVELGGSMVYGGAPNPDGLLGQANVAVDRSAGATRGHVYVLASVDPAGSDPADVNLVRSADRGATWSAPIRVNDDPVGNGAWQWFGAHSVAPDGRIDVVWNDTRASGQAGISELYYAYSYDGGASWHGNAAVSPPFNSRIGWPNQSKIGDYYTIIAAASGADVAYAATFNGEQDVYYLRVFPDCNENGVSDVDDIASGTSPDADGNGIPDECEPLLLAGPDPGVAGQPNTATVTGATPDAQVGVVFAFAAGTSAVPGCPGVSFGLANPRGFGVDVADAQGNASVTRPIPAGLAGRAILLQALDRASCRISNRVGTVLQ